MYWFRLITKIGNLSSSWCDVCMLILKIIIILLIIFLGFIKGSGYGYGTVPDGRWAIDTEGGHVVVSVSLIRNGYEYGRRSRGRLFIPHPAHGSGYLFMIRPYFIEYNNWYQHRRLVCILGIWLEWMVNNYSLLPDLRTWSSKHLILYLFWMFYHFKSTIFLIFAQKCLIAPAHLRKVVNKKVQPYRNEN